ncbi:MAG TPA: GTPase ObgE [Leptospiraceae bacterium]|nr:GTPase ObgE [Leptospiraceae bacterium]
MKFIDSIEILIRGGHGGSGAVSFHRAKYVPKGGPDGGDGGHGGSVKFLATNRVSTLGKFRSKKVYGARPGEAGQKRNRSGADGEHLVLQVPVGTVITDADTEEIIADLNLPESTVIAAQGGRGGQGNARFANSINQAPEYAQPGMPGEEKRILLNLKLIADAGLVGLPNAGKSTLLSKVTANQAKIGAYAFTTLNPNLGVLENEDRRILMADIPGIIEGASKGAGLGLSFLRHIERVRVIIYILDLTSVDPAADLRMLRMELKHYNPELTERPGFIILNKLDEIDYDEQFASELAQALKEEMKGLAEDIVFISAKEEAGLNEFKQKLFACFPETTQAERMISLNAPESVESPE